MNATVAKQWLWRSGEDFEIESPLRQGVSFKTYKIYITAIFTQLVLEVCKNKNLQNWFKATLTMETRKGYIFNTHGYQREGHQREIIDMVLK